MSVVLIGHRLWRFVIRDKTKPTKTKKKSVNEFDELPEIWKTTSFKILS